MGLRVNTDTVPVDSVVSRPTPVSQALIVTGDYKATDPTAVEFTPPNMATQVLLVLDITAQTGAGNTVTLNIEMWDPAANRFISVPAASPTFAAGGATTNKILITPYLASGAGPPQIVQNTLAGTLRVRPVGTGTRTTLNYSISAHWSE